MSEEEATLAASIAGACIVAVLLVLAVHFGVSLW